MDKFQEYVQVNRDRFIAELQDFCRQPSVAAQNLGMREMADKVLARLKQLGADARTVPVEGGAPVVYGEIGSGPIEARYASIAWMRHIILPLLSATPRA